MLVRTALRYDTTVAVSNVTMHGFEYSSSLITNDSSPNLSSIQSITKITEAYRLFYLTLHVRPETEFILA